MRVLLDALKGQKRGRDTVLALGLLGDLAAVAPLVDLLDDDDLAEPAAVALNTITGAQLHASVFVPDKFDPDELLDEEREAYEKRRHVANPPRRTATATGSAAPFSTRRAGVHGWTRTSIASIERFVGAWAGPTGRRRCSSV